MSKDVKTTVIGGIFVVIAAICAAIIGCYATIMASGNTGSGSTEPPSQATASIVIYDKLGEEQLSETVDIIIDGKKRGSVVIDQNRPEDSMTITMPPGRYSYTLNAVATFTDQNTYYGTGQGIIEIVEGKEYDLQASYSGSTWLLTLIERK